MPNNDNSGNNVVLINDEYDNFTLHGSKKEEGGENDLDRKIQELLRAMKRHRRGNNLIEVVQNLDNTSLTNTLNSNYSDTTHSDTTHIDKANDVYNLFEKFGLEYNRPTAITFSSFSKEETITSKDEEYTNSLVEEVKIDTYIEGLDDLLRVINTYPIKRNVKYNIDMQALHNIKEPLISLSNMIGMQNLKTSIVDQLLYFVQGLHKVNSYNNQDFMHTVISGPPGTGKTEVAKIIGQILSKLGVLKSNKFKKVTRSDLVAGYLGQTAIKTRDVIKESLGGVLFIDEAYSLGNGNNDTKDSFAKECVDTLCEAMSDHKSELMVIIAGYKNELDECFFSINKGLESRFTWRFETDDYNPSELKQIFEKKVLEAGWSFETDFSLKDIWFEKYMDSFKYYGRDMEKLFAKVKIMHSRRVFCRPPEDKTKINIDDMDKGFELYSKNDYLSSSDVLPSHIQSMYS